MSVSEHVFHKIAGGRSDADEMVQMGMLVDDVELRKIEMKSCRDIEYGIPYCWSEPNPAPSGTLHATSVALSRLNKAQSIRRLEARAFML